MGANINTYQGANTFLPPSPVVPTFLTIISVTKATQMMVTTSTPNSYVPNQMVYFSVPFDYGMYQLNGLTGLIIDIDPTNLIFTIAINSSQFDTFVIPSGSPLIVQPATMSPAGSRNNYNFTSVPFHSLGNFGN